MFELTGIEKDFVNKTMIAQALRPKINKWDLMKLNFLNSKGYNQVKRQLQNGKKSYQSYICGSLNENVLYLHV